MTRKIHSDDVRIRRLALTAALGVHVLAAIVAWVYYLDEPERKQASEVLSLSIEMPAVTTIEPGPRPGPQGNDAPGERRPALPSTVLPPPIEPELLGDLPVAVETVPDIRKRFSEELLSSMSQEEAFDSLMVLLEEFPEFRPTILKKMVAGKGIDRIPDLYVSTGIRDYHKKMKFKSKYEYELMRQYHMYGAYHDPVNGPWGYKKTGVQVNMIELVSWLVDLIGGK